MPDRTKIVFSNGHELEVDGKPSQVMDVLNRNEVFHQFKKTTTGADVDVYVVHDRVAYIEQLPETQASAPVFGTRPSTHKID